MKKLIGILLTMVLVVSLFVGCSTKKEDSSSESKNSVEKSDQTEKKTEDKTEDKAEKPKELKKLRVAYHPNMGGASTIITGIKTGAFEEQGLEIELVKFTSGPPEIAAMVSGDIDVGYIGMGAHFLAIDGQVDLIAIDALGNSDRLLTRAETGIKNIEDLVGKKVAVPLGTSGETVFDLALEKANVSRDKIKVVNMDVAGAVSAYISGQVDAAAIWAPYTLQSMETLGEDKVVELAKNEDFMPDYVFPSSWIATPHYIEKNRETVVKFVKGLYKAMDYRANNIDEMVGWTAELVEMEKDVVAKEVPQMIMMTTSDIKEALDTKDILKWFEGLEKLFMKTGKIDDMVPVEDFLNTGILSDALK